MRIGYATARIIGRKIEKLPVRKGLSFLFYIYICIRNQKNAGRRERGFRFSGLSVLKIMACILNLETSTAVCSAALAADGAVVFEKVSFDGPSHAVLLGVYVEEALRAMKERGLTLDAVAVSSGPGSYTGLRIGVSVAKGLCFGYGIPLIGIRTLDILAAAAVARPETAPDDRFCAMLDARRMEVYASLYDASLRPLRETRAEVVTADTYASELEKGRVCFFGNGAAKCRSVITSPNALFLDDIFPLAASMAPLSEQAFREGRLEDVAYFEPFYLKEFQATIAKNKVLNEAIAEGRRQEKA